jgi:hypothetical protein
MDQFFHIKENFINSDLCGQMINQYKADQNFVDSDTRLVNESMFTINELYLNDPNVVNQWTPFVKDIKEKLDNEVEEYLKNFATVKLGSYNFSHGVFWEQEEFTNVPLHFDSEFAIEKDQEDPIRNFFCIVYMNDNFEGGQLAFPVQKKIFEPKKGMLIIFPTSYMFPHMTTPAIGGSRFLMRLTYYLNKEKKIADGGY